MIYAGFARVAVVLRRRQTCMVKKNFRARSIIIKIFFRFNLSNWDEHGSKEIRKKFFNFSRLCFHVCECVCMMLRYLDDFIRVFRMGNCWKIFLFSGSGVSESRTKQLNNENISQ